MRVIRKIFYTTLSFFIILTVYTITNIKDNTLRTNFEIDDVINIKTNSIYLLNKDNYLTKVDVFIDKENQIINIIDYLKKSNKKTISNYKGYIPSNTKVIDIEVKDNILFLNLSEDFLKEDTNITVPGLVRSILSIKNIEKVDLKVNNKYIDGYNKLLDNNISINKEYFFNSRNNINRVIVYYLYKDNNYVPVTKYLNDDRDKIEIIIDELKNNSKINLISYLNNDTKLLDYEEENDIMFLNFNSYLNNDKTTADYNLNEIAYSIFDNYNVSSVMFKVNNKNLKIINKK